MSICYLRTAIEEQGCLSDWLPAAETWQMDSKSNPKAAVATTQGKRAAGGQWSLSHVQSHSQLSVSSITSENSAPNMVYQRRKHLKGTPPFSSDIVPANLSPDTINFVYERRKHQKSVVTNFSAVVSVDMSPNGAFNSAIRSENPSAASVEKTRGSHEMLAAAGVSSTSAVFCNKELLVETTETIDGSIAEDRGSDVKDKMNKTVELHSVDDSCSSSMLRMDIGSGPLKIEIDETDECSSSGMIVANVTGDDLLLPAKDLCISILRSHGLLSESGTNRADDPDENPPSCSGSSCSRSCNICGLPGIAKDMLICDDCEEAFHVPCCHNVRSMPIDEWYCQSCSKKKHKLIKERMVRKSSIIRNEKFPVASEGDLSAIEMILRDTEPYTSNVRVGKGFQAIVPEWSGPDTKNIDDFPQPMELDPSDPSYMPGLSYSKPSRSNYIGNWLQCREVIVGMGEAIDGTVCGKWRRAPLFDVQTDNWDCFSSVFWDPSHADCAVAQELETEEVLKQLKYIEMLRPRLAAKRRKIQVCRSNSSLVSTEDTSNCTHSENWAKVP